MSLLESIAGPRDLRGLTEDQLAQLASEIRDLLVDVVLTGRRPPRPQPRRGRADPRHPPGLRLPARPGRLRHRPPGLRAQDADRTGRRSSTACARRAASAATRARPSPTTTSSRTPTPRPSLSYADGLAKAYAIRGEDRHIVAVIGDGALTGGMAWEALNNIAIAQDSRLVIVVNDNGRSYTPTVGGLATALTTLRTNPRYEHVLDLVKKRLNAVPGVGPAVVRRPARDEEGPQGRARAAGPLRGPRPEVRRPGRRPRP